MNNRPQSVMITKPVKLDKALKSTLLTRAQSMHVKNLMQHERRERSKTTSFGALEDLVRCAICLNRLTHPRMLPCQHTFCLECLKTYAMAKSLSKNTESTNEIHFNCPTCHEEIKLDKKTNTLDNLPRNLHVESLLKVVDTKPNSPTNKDSVENRCVKCQTVSKENICQHCIQVFCNICFNVHLSELEENLSSLLEQLDESQERLDHKLEIYENRCEQLNEQVKEAAKAKHFEVEKLEAVALNNIDDMKTQGRYSLTCIRDKIQQLRGKIENGGLGDGRNKVITFMQLHQETSKLFDVVHSFGEERIVFDPTSFKLEEYIEGIYNEVTENDNIISTAIVTHPLENAESLTVHYKMRCYTPKLVWSKCPKPAGTTVSPWDSTKLYIAATDTHHVLIFNKDKQKLIGRVSHSEMICPQGLTFSKSEKELYVSDKWKHCIHVFSSSNEYLRTICSKGSANGKLRNPDGLAIGPNNELLVADTGNNRISVINPANGEQISTIGLINGKITLNMPTSVAVYGNTVIIADTGNHRIKVFDINGTKLHEFGSFGKNHAQFRSAEVVAVDPLGFIFVGDSGNARIQIFKPDGTLVKIIGSSHGENRFMWVSGIAVTSDLDIIVTDSKARSLKIF